MIRTMEPFYFSVQLSTAARDFCPLSIWSGPWFDILTRHYLVQLCFELLNFNPNPDIGSNSGTLTEPGKSRTETYRTGPFADHRHTNDALNPIIRLASELRDGSDAEYEKGLSLNILNEN